jgi:hypothetical protein
MKIRNDFLKTDCEIFTRPDQMLTGIEHYNRISDLSQLSKKFVIIMHPDLIVLNLVFWSQINWLLQQNKFLEAIKHPAWIALNRDYVWVKPGKDYWAFNLRPVHGFDNTTWTKNDSTTI